MAIKNQYSIFTLKVESCCWLKTISHPSMQSLLSVQPFSLNEIRASFYISLGYQSSVYLLPFKITNNGNRRPVVPISSISDAHSRFPAWFINVCFRYFENTTLELPAIPIIYPFLSMLYVSSSWILCRISIDWYSLNSPVWISILC